MDKTSKSTEELIEIIKEREGIPKDVQALVITRRALARFEAAAFLEGASYAYGHPWPHMYADEFSKARSWFFHHLYGENEWYSTQHRDEMIKTIRKLAEKKDAEEAKAIEEAEKGRKKTKRRRKG